MPNPESIQPPASWGDVAPTATALDDWLRQHTHGPAHALQVCAVEILMLMNEDPSLIGYFDCVWPQMRQSFDEVSLRRASRLRSLLGL